MRVAARQGRGGARRAIWALLVALPGWALAHPIDEVVQGAYLTLAPGEVRLELDVTPGTEVAALVLPLLDPDGDGVVSDAEARAYAQGVLADPTLVLDGAPAAWSLVAVEVADLGLVAEGAGVIRIDATAPRPDREGARTLAYENPHEPARGLWMANVFLQPGGGWTHAVTGQERDARGQALTVSHVAAPE